MKILNNTFRVSLENDGDDIDFVKDVHRLYNLDVQADEHNITPAREDMQFVIGDQWDADTKLRRERLNKPALTINRLPAFVAQYLGSRLQSDLSIKLSPTSGGSKKVAEIRQGIIRTIMRTRVAKNALFQASQTAYICGIGNFELCLKEAQYDVFARDITLNSLEDPFQVIWDRAATEPTGADANHCYVFDYVTKDDFNEAYPDANEAGWPMDDVASTIMTGHGWEVDEMIRICRFWQMKHEPVTLALEASSGDVIDVTDWEWDKIVATAAPDENGDPITRETTKPYAECWVLGSTEILEGPFRYECSRLPVFRVEGWCLREASVRFRWGFVRNAKDPQRLHNYWRSIIAEELQKSPASKWLLDSAAMKNGLADKFRDAHLSGDPVLEWDSQSDGAKPEFLEPPRINQAVLTEAGMTVQDMRDVTNRHEASMGQTSNEVSGKAITARQRVSELGDIIYDENMNAAMAECCKVMNELIPIVYDTERQVKITGPDDVEEVVLINSDETPDVTQGKYDLTYSTGPSYATKRQEAVDTIQTLMNTMPQVGNMIADILVRNMDIPGAEEIEERLAMLLPPGMLNLDKISEQRRARIEEQQAAQKAQTDKSEAMQMEMFGQQLKKIMAEEREINARAWKTGAQGDLAASQVGVAAAELEIKDDANTIKAAAVAVKIDENQVSTVKAGLDAAREDIQIEREERQDQQKESPNSSGGTQE